MAALTPSQEIDKFINDLDRLARKVDHSNFATVDSENRSRSDRRLEVGSSCVGVQRQCGCKRSFQDHVKLNFFKGASLPDPKKLFNAGLEAKATRAIDFAEGDTVDEAALKELIRAAVAFNVSGGKKK